MRLLICFFVLVSAGFAELGLTVAGKDAQLQQAKVQVQLHGRFYGDWNEDAITTVTAEVEVIRNFGTACEKREIHALRVQEKTEGVVLKATVYPEGWE